MGDPIWGWVKIKVPADWLWIDDPERGIAVYSDWRDQIDGSPLAEAVDAAVSVRDWPSALEEQVEVFYTPDGDFATIQYSGNFSGGVACDALAALKAARIPYVAHSDPQYEFMGTNYNFDPIAGISRRCEADSDAYAVIRVCDLEPLLGEPEKILEAIRQRVEIDEFDITQCSIEHLRALSSDDEPDVEGTPMFIIDPQEES